MNVKNIDKMITYAHKDDPNGIRFRQYLTDKIPDWAVNIRPYYKGGFRKIDDKLYIKEPCRHPEHQPPMHIVLENGTYEYTCPGCGEVRTIVVNKPTL